MVQVIVLHFAAVALSFVGVSQGHLLELGQACEAENAKDQLREVEEVSAQT